MTVHRRKSVRAILAEQEGEREIAEETEQKQLDGQSGEQSAIETVSHSNTQTGEQPHIEPSEQLDSKPGKQPDSKTVGQQAGKTTKQQRIKATFYLYPKDIIAIDEMQTQRFRETGKKPEKSELVSEAIQLLSKQQNS